MFALSGFVILPPPATAICGTGAFALDLGPLNPGLRLVGIVSPSGEKKATISRKKKGLASFD